MKEEKNKIIIIINQKIKKFNYKLNFTDVLTTRPERVEVEGLVRLNRTFLKIIGGEVVDQREGFNLGFTDRLVEGEGQMVSVSDLHGMRRDIETESSRPSKSRVK